MGFVESRGRSRWRDLSRATSRSVIFCRRTCGIGCRTMIWCTLWLRRWNGFRCWRLMECTPLVELAFQTQVHSVIDQCRVVEPVPVADQAADHGAEIQQGMPLTAVSRQFGRLDRQHQPDPALAHGLEKRLKTRPVNTSTGNPQILIDHFDFMKAELFRMICQRRREFRPIGGAKPYQGRGAVLVY